MNRPNHWIFGLALVLALTLTLGLPGAAQAQQNDPAASYGPAGQDYNSGYYGANCRGYNYCPMGPGHGYSAPGKPGLPAICFQSQEKSSPCRPWFLEFWIRPRPTGRLGLLVIVTAN